MNMRLTLGWIGAGLVLALAGCNGSSGTAGATAGGTAANTASLPLVAFAQANSQDPWRQVFDRDTKAEAAKFSNDMQFEEQEAGDDVARQVSDIETFMVKKPKVLLVSTVTEAVQS